MLRVLCFGRFCDELPGGIQSHVHSLLTGLRERVAFINLVPSRDWRGSRFQLADGTPVVRTPGWDVDGSLALSPGLLLEARLQHRQTPFDLIHLHLPDPMSHLAALTLPGRIPRVVTWHADILRASSLVRLYRPWQSRLLARAAAVIVPTPEHIESSPALQPPEIRAKTRVIPFGFDLTRFATPHPDAEKIRAAWPGRRIFALGRHVAYKGFDVLLAALRQLTPDVKLLLGGVGPLGEALRRQAAELGIADRVHFAGLIPDTELPAWYQACEVFCLPSLTRAEAFGIVQLEAMAAGLPVVGARLGNGVDCVNQDGKTGLTVPPGDARALACALASVLSQDELRQRLGTTAQRRALAEFRIEVMAERTLALYEAVAAASGGARPT